ncbi:MAG: hypothetical protein L6Q60_09590 [Rhodocyclaceae bacterium]|nr:hypothetical protein [Rhodocyclaceae bacterium]
MEIGSVSTAAGAAVEANRQAQAQQVEQLRKQTEQQKPESQPQEPRPVTNAEGQTTGKVINVTA